MPVAGKATTATSLTTITGTTIKNATNIATTTRITIDAEPASPIVLLRSGDRSI